MADTIKAPVGEAFSLNDYISFDAGQGLSEHTSPYDAVVYILDGESEITIGGEKKVVKTGEMMIMPADIPHSLHAAVPFKMNLIMIRSASTPSDT